MPMSRNDWEFIEEHVVNTIMWFVCVPLLIIIVLLGIIFYKIFFLG
jgi:hypothetical protein